jgi:hypothetical protein
VSKFDHELGEVALYLLAGQRLNANLEASARPESRKRRDRSVSGLISALLPLAPQVMACQGRNAVSRSRNKVRTDQSNAPAAASA